MAYKIWDSVYKIVQNKYKIMIYFSFLKSVLGGRWHAPGMKSPSRTGALDPSSAPFQDLPELGHRNVPNLAFSLPRLSFSRKIGSTYAVENQSWHDRNGRLDGHRYVSIIRQQVVACFRIDASTKFNRSFRIIIDQIFETLSTEKNP